MKLLKRMRTKRLLSGLKWIVSAVLVVYLAFCVRWAMVVRALHSIEFKYFALSTLVALSACVFWASKHYLLIKGSAIAMPLLSLIKINFVSIYYSLILPTSIGRESVRWYKVTKNGQGRSFFLSVIIFERLVFILMLLLLGILPLYFYRNNAALSDLRTKLLPLIFVVLLIVVTGLAYLVTPKIQRRFQRFLIKQTRTARWQEKFLLFLQDFALRDVSPEMIVKIVLLTCLWDLCFIGRIYLLFKSLALPLVFLDAVWMSSLVLLLQMLPISIAGIGLREGVYGFLFSLLAMPAEQGVTVGILFFMQMLFFSSIGAGFELSGTT